MPEPTSLQTLQNAWKRFLTRIGLIREETLQVMERIEKIEKETYETELTKKIKQF